MQPLSFNIRVMKLLVLWPETTVTTKFVIKHVFVLFTMVLDPYFMAVAAFRQLHHLESIVILLDHIIGLGCVVACIYMSECFVQNVKNIKKLSDQITAFSKDFGVKPLIEQTEKKIQKYTKVTFQFIVNVF